MANETMTPWQAKAAKKRADEHAKIPAAWRLPAEHLVGIDATADISVMDVPRTSGLLSAVELEITERYSAVTLAQAVQSGQVKATAVAEAFCKRAAIAQQLTNCLTETMFDDALKRGNFLDAYLAEHNRAVGPLHGVPVSLKDSFNCVGVQSCLGYVSFLDNPPASKNSPLVDVLLELGAILYCKTNIPQSLMTADSDNNVFGRVLNPHRLSLGAGGSSGGEGALIAMRGSILGVGTDIAGSIRIPSMCCGTYGFKPSTHRIPYGGQTPPARMGSPGIPAVAGPLANSFDDLQFFVRHVIGASPWNKDPTALAIPWRAPVADGVPLKLRVGFWPGDSAFPIHPPASRALQHTSAKIAAAGHTVIPVAVVPSVMRAVQVASDMFSLDPSKMFLQHIAKSGEPIIPSLQKTLAIVGKPTAFSVDNIFDLNVARLELAASWHKVFVDNHLDVLLCPGAPFTAMPHDAFGTPPYTALWSLLEVRCHIWVFLITRLTSRSTLASFCL